MPVRNYGKYTKLAGQRWRARNRARASAARSIQRAWKIKKRRRRGSLIQRTALSNRRAIKRIKKDVELKFVSSAVASVRTNYCGQILGPIKVDNWCMAQSTADWVAAGPAATQLPATSYCPLIMNPVLVKQAGQTFNTNVQAATENARVGNDIVLSHITFKITMTGGDASANGGNLQNVAQRQSLTAVLLLDREPAEQNATLTQLAPAFDQTVMSGQWLPRTPDNVLAIPGTQGKPFELVKGCQRFNANPPGISTGNIATKNMDALSFYSKDTVMGKTGRFKILKKMKLSCSQYSTNPNQVSVVSTSSTKTMTYKGRLKLHFDGDSLVIPGNQTVLLCLYSDTPTIRNAGGQVPTHYADPPKVTVLSRVSFRDS